jgi:hypothetical protein
MMLEETLSSLDDYLNGLHSLLQNQQARNGKEGKNCHKFQ